MNSSLGSVRSPGSRPWFGAYVVAIACGLVGGGCDVAPAAEDRAFRDGPRCGNGQVEGDEACDLGFANGPRATCRPDCQLARCGDGVPDEGERCDDGNADDDDGCRSDCRRPLRSTWIRAPAGGERPAVALGLGLVPDGAGAVVVGRSQSGLGAPRRAWLAGYAPDGERRWSRWLPDDDALRSATARAVAVDPSGDVWVTGEVRGSDDDDFDLWVARCDPQGNPRWSLTEDFGGGDDRGQAIAVADGGAIVGGSIVLAANDRDGLVLAVGPEAERRFTWRHDGPAGAIDDVRAVATTSEGGVVVGGGEDDLTRWWLTKLDSSGRPVGTARRAGAVGAWVVAIAVHERGDLWIAGTEVLAATEPSDSSTWHTQPWLARLDATAQVRWQRAEPPASPARREAFGLALAPDGEATLVGTDPIPGEICSSRYCPGRLWLARYTRDGARRYWAVPDQMVRGEGRAVVEDDTGALWLAGSRRLVFAEADPWVARYREQGP